MRYCLAMEENAKLERRRVLSVQSHVVSGYAGNKSATFPLQLLGFEVDAINSVQFSNHTGYDVVKGQVLEEKHLAQLFEGLEANDLLKSYSHLLTGYIGNVSFLRRIAEILKTMRQINPDLIYICDPVMGDNGEMYVPKELLPVYRDEIVVLADVVTPNQTEVELLTDIKINSEADIWRAVQWFHDRNISTVVISSSELSDSDHLRAYLSKKNGPRYAIDIPKQGGGISFTGTGDLFAALFLAHSYQADDLGCALEKTISTLQAVIKRTIAHTPAEVREGRRKVHSSERELKLIQSKTDIEAPTVLLRAEQKS